MRSLTPPIRLEKVSSVSSKRGDIELCLGQCAAQMVATRLFNERVGMAGPVFGVVTTGEAWQFLCLDGAALTLHTERLYIDNLGGILAALQASLMIAGAVRI